MYFGFIEIRIWYCSSNVAGDASQTDLRVDVLNHGTLVAGIIALNGPVNVKIINLKVAVLNERDQNLKKKPID